MKLVKPFCVWLTGLPSSGKTTLASTLRQQLITAGLTTIHLDGDVVRKGLNSDLGLSKKDREENNRRVIHVSKIIVESGVPVITSFISPYQIIRDFARKTIPEYLEFFVDSPLEICMQRDVKGLYAKAKSGELLDLTGFNAPYEVPKNPDLRLLTAEMKVDQTVDEVIKFLLEKGYLALDSKKKPHQNSSQSKNKSLKKLSSITKR